MVQLDYFEKFPNYKAAILSIYRELGESFNKHATLANLSRHIAKNERKFVRHLVGALLKIGYLRKHRTDTFAWTNAGLEYAKGIIFSEK